MGVRITPPERMAVQNSNLFYMQATSAETNVLNVASSLGHECLALTTVSYTHLTLPTNREV